MGHMFQLPCEIIVELKETKLVSGAYSSDSSSENELPLEPNSLVAKAVHEKLGSYLIGNRHHLFWSQI